MKTDAAALTKELQEMLSTLKNAPADLYKQAWGKEEDFSRLPAISRSDLIKIPLSRRRYKDAKSLVKIVHDPEGSFLSEWSFEDIGAEEVAPVSKRPFVYLSDPHEAIEKALWCYEQGVVPLLGEKDAAIAGYAAKKYQVDSLIADPLSLPKLSSYLQELPSPLDSITVVSDSFHTIDILPFAHCARTVRLVLSLPETGPIAHAELAERPTFKPVAGCLIETEDTLIVSKTAQLVTPIVKYRTAIPTELYDGAQ